MPVTWTKLAGITSSLKKSDSLICSKNDNNNSTLQAHYCVYFLCNFVVQGGKNFHIFHYLLYGMDADQLQEYILTSDYPHRSANHNFFNN